jgi:signal transduction histidine kinase
MSHELRTPLNAIGGYVDLLELGIRGSLTQLQREDLARIQRSQRHLLGLINEVLNYTRIETGAVRYELTDVRLDDAVASIEPLIRPQFQAKRLGLVIEPPTIPLVARADRDKIQQVLLNLLSNAVKFTDHGGLVTVRCTTASDDTGGRAVRLHVCDTGEGIPAAKLGAVFEPFVQVHTGLTRPHDGAGLGLAISRDLARGMGGDLTVDSTLGVGSTFTLSLPSA